MMSTIKSSRRQSISFTSLLLLFLFLLMNGCTSKKLSTGQPDPAAEPEEIQEEKEGRKKKKEKKEERKEIKKQGKEEQQEKEKKKKRQKKKKRNKPPATQRPYVIEGRTYYPVPTAEGYEETGLASWYGDPFHGRKTANGETYNMYGVTAAHKTLPMNTMLLVKNLANDKTTIVRINDRGPFVDGRIIDLSYTTAKELDIVRNGTEKVRITALCAVEKQEAKQEVSDNKKKKERKTEPGLPILTAQKKKRKSEKSSGINQTMCAVTRQDFDKGNFYIQVGSFEEKNKARKLARTFADQGRNVVIQEFAAAGSSLFRVLVFSSTSLKEAKKHNEKLKKQGFEHAFVIARDKKKQESKKNARQQGRKSMTEKLAVR